MTRLSKQRRQILSKLLLPAALKNFGSKEIQIVPHCSFGAAKFVWGVAIADWWFCTRQIGLPLLDNLIVVFTSVPVLHLSHFQLTLLLSMSIIGSTLVVQALQAEELPIGTVWPIALQKAISWCGFLFANTKLHNSVYCPLHCLFLSYTVGGYGRSGNTRSWVNIVLCQDKNNGRTWYCTHVIFPSSGFYCWQWHTPSASGKSNSLRWRFLVYHLPIILGRMHDLLKRDSLGMVTIQRAMSDKSLCITREVLPFVSHA